MARYGGKARKVGDSSIQKARVVARYPAYAGKGRVKNAT